MITPDVAGITCLSDPDTLSKYTHVISCFYACQRESIKLLTLPHGVIHKVYYFDDAEDNENEVCEADKPNAEDIADLIEFVSFLPADARILVHCAVGASRSPAMALGCLAASTRASDPNYPAQAIAQWTGIRYATYRFKPNKRILRLLDEALTPGSPKLTEAIEQWEAKNHPLFGEI